MDDIKKELFKKLDLIKTCPNCNKEMESSYNINAPFQWQLDGHIICIDCFSKITGSGVMRIDDPYKHLRGKI